MPEHYKKKCKVLTVIEIQNLMCILNENTELDNSGHVIYGSIILQKNSYFIFVIDCVTTKINKSNETNIPVTSLKTLLTSNSFEPSSYFRAWNVLTKWLQCLTCKKVADPSPLRTTFDVVIFLSKDLYLHCLSIRLF